MDEQKRLLTELETILADFDNSYLENDIRGRILLLIPAFDTIRDLGKSIIPDGNKISARNRLLKYFLVYPRVILNEKELAIVAGISEWARRVRELRVEHGWKIITGVTAKEMLSENEFEDYNEPRL